LRSVSTNSCVNGGHASILKEQVVVWVKPTIDV
jgi:hypothetical protein